MESVNNSIIQAFREQRQQFQVRLEAVSRNLTFADAVTSVQLEQQRDYLIEQIQRIDNQINETQRTANKEAVQDLIKLLTLQYAAIQPQVISAYERTLRFKRSIAQPVNSPSAIISNLLGWVEEKVPYSYLHRFVGHLLAELLAMQESPLSLLNDLGEWAATHIPNCTELQQQIEAERAEQDTQKDCLMIRVRRSNVKSTKQSDCYFIDAWFIADIETYRRDQTRVHPVRLRAVDELVSPEQTYSREGIEATIRQLRQQCFESYGAERPLIHVFVPMELLNLDIDCWLLQEGRRRRRFGTHHEVVLRSIDRLNDLEYDLKKEWQTKWRSIEGKLPEAAEGIFRGVPCNVDVLYAEGQLPESLAIRLTQALLPLSESEQSELFETLILESAIPLAFWLRQPAIDRDCCSALTAILREACLKDLPNVVQRKRLEVFNVNAELRDNHVGNHLALLWDDPKLVPPTPDAA